MQSLKKIHAWAQMKVPLLKTLPVRLQKVGLFFFYKNTDFHPKIKTFHSDFYFIIKSGQYYIKFNDHFSVFLCRCRVSVAANGFQKFAISLLKMKFLPNFNTIAPL